MPVNLGRMLDEARDLCSEDDSNPEYDRALIELTCRCFGIGQDDPRRDTIEREIRA